MPKIVDDETVFQAAMQAVMSRGYDGATTRQIAESAGISEVTLFRKYGSKSELIKRAFTAQGVHFDFELAAAYTGDIAADLLRVLVQYQGSAEKSGQFFHTMLSEVPRHPELAELVEMPLGMVAAIGRMLARYQAEGVLVEEPPMQSVAALVGPLIVTNMINNTRPDKPIPPIELAGHVDRFLNGRRAR